MSANCSGRRRRLALLLNLLLVITLFGCARPSDPPKPVYKGKLTLWAATGLAGYPVSKPDGDFFATEAKAFTAKHTEIQVDVRLFDSPGALEEALLTGSETPDLAFSRFLPGLAGRLANLQVNTADYLPGALDAFQTPGQLTGLPALLDLQVLLLNEQRFAEAGLPLPAEGKWSRNELESSLRKLSGAGKYGLGFYQLPGYHEWWPLVDGLLTAEGAIAPGAADGFARLARYRQEGLLHPDTAKLTAEETWAQFARGEIAVMPAAPWAIPLLAGPDYQVKLAVAGFPEGATVGYTYGFLTFRQQEEAKLQAAVALAQAIGSAENLSRLAQATGLMPARKSSPNPFPNDPALTRALQLAATQRPLPAGPAWAKAEVAAARELTLALLGAREPAAAIQTLQTHFQTAIAPAPR